MITILIPKIISKIKEGDWKDLLLGLQEYFDVTQLQLLSEVGIKRNFKISYWISGKTNVSYQNKVKFINFILKNKLNINKLIKFGKKVRNSIKFKGKWVSIKNALTKKDFTGSLIVNKGKHSYLNIPKLFPDLRKNNDIYFIPYRNKLIISYKEKRSARPFPLYLPRFLKLNKDFLVGLGIYLAEGSRNRRPKVTNSEPLLINQAIKFFKLISINKVNLKAWIQLHERSTKSFKEVKDFWLRNINLEKTNITKIRIKKSVGNFKVKQYGVLHLESMFILSQLLIKGLLNSIDLILRSLNKKEIIWFLKGAYAGEGSVTLTKKGSVSTIHYTSINKKERYMIKSLLEKLGIKVREDEKYYSLDITGFFNIQKILRFDLFKYHPERRKKLFEGFDILKNNNIPNLNKTRILNLLSKNKREFTIKEIKQKLGLSYNNSKKHLRELYKLAKIKKSGSNGPIPSKWFI